MKCILHIGMHKTGTSTIQASLKDYDDGQTAYASLSPNGNHSAALQAIFSKDYMHYGFWKDAGLTDDQLALSRNNFREKLEQQIALHAGKNLILSGEDMSTLPPDGAKALIDFMKLHFDEIEVIAYVRDPLEFAASAFQEDLKHGSRELQDKIQPRYRKKIEMFLTLVGKDNLTVRHFAREKLVNADVLQDFCQIAGLDYSKAQPTQENVSLNSEVSKLLYCFNRSNLMTEGDLLVMKWNLLFRRIIGLLFNNGTALPKDIFASVADYSDAVWLKDEFGIEFPEPHSDPVSREELEEWLTDVPDSVISRLELFLKGNNIDIGHKGDVAKLLNRIFCLCVQGYQLSADGARLVSPPLIGKNADILASVAMKYESKQEVTRNEALALMTMAYSAHPANEIRQKLAQWGA